MTNAKRLSRRPEWTIDCSSSSSLVENAQVIQCPKERLVALFSPNLRIY